MRGGRRPDTWGSAPGGEEDDAWMHGGRRAGRHGSASVVPVARRSWMLSGDVLYPLACPSFWGVVIAEASPAYYLQRLTLVIVTIKSSITMSWPSCHWTRDREMKREQEGEKKRRGVQNNWRRERGKVKTAGSSGRRGVKRMNGIRERRRRAYV